jgi:predicted SnoaL-like aldol condensation-catalyzing enzyme
MSPTPDALIRQWFEELWNQGKEDTIDRLMAPETVVHGLPTPDGQPLRGPEAFKPFFHAFRGAFPDLRVTVVRTVAQGDTVAAHCHTTGTHLAHTRGDKLIEGWNCFDFLALYQQLGVLPQMPA